MRGNPSKNSASPTAIQTGGEVLEDGTLIELVEDLAQPGGLALLVWDGDKCVVAPSAEHGGQTYVPVALHPTLRSALRLPSKALPIETTAALFAELFDIMRRFTDLGEESCFLLVGYVFISWLADCLPLPINLTLWSPVAAEAARVLRLLSCLCRQALPLSGTCARDIGLLPPELQATLLIFRPGGGRRTRELLSTCGWRGFHTVRSGKFGEFIGSVVVSTEAPMKARCLEPMIEIPIPPSKRPLPVLDQRAQKELAREFLPKLLAYRLLHHRTVGAESADAASAGPSTQLAAGLHLCFSDEPTLLRQQLTLVVEAEQNGCEARLIDPRVPVIEVLWARCHDTGRQKLYVAEVAADVNAVFAASGSLELSTRMVGSVLRSVGVRTAKLDRKGRGIKLDKATRALIHHLAQVHEVPSAGKPFAGCAECSQVQRPEGEEVANE